MAAAGGGFGCAETKCVIVKLGEKSTMKSSITGDRLSFKYNLKYVYIGLNLQYLVIITI